MQASESEHCKSGGSLTKATVVRAKYIPLLWIYCIKVDDSGFLVKECSLITSFLIN